MYEVPEEEMAEVKRIFCLQEAHDLVAKTAVDDARSRVCSEQSQRGFGAWERRGWLFRKLSVLSFIEGSSV